MSSGLVTHLRIPKRLQIETIFGCNARCVMCAVSLPVTRKTGVMPPDLFWNIIDSLSPYSKRIEKVDLFGLGEPLLDQHIFEKIRYVKEKGFQNLAISTNADLLNTEKQLSLLETGIETVILSIDGVKKDTHENIRRGVKFERVVDNCQNIIRVRNERKHNTKFVFRFIRQPSNESEWEPFLAYWQSKLSSEYGDLLIAYNVNTMGGEVLSKKEVIGSHVDEIIEKRPCHQVFDRLIILNDGTVPLCCEDTPYAKYAMGDVKKDSPINIFNGSAFQCIREIHGKGDKNGIAICKECTLLYSESKVRVYKGLN